MLLYVAAVTSGIAFYLVVYAGFLASDSYKTRKSLPLVFAAVLFGVGSAFATCAISMFVSAAG